MFEYKVYLRWVFLWVYGLVSKKAALLKVFPVWKKNYSFVFGFEVLAIRGKYCLNMRCMYFLEGKLYCWKLEYFQCVLCYECLQKLEVTIWSKCAYTYVALEDILRLNLSSLHMNIWSICIYWQINNLYNIP